MPFRSISALSQPLTLCSYLSSSKDILDGLGNFRPDTITLDQTDCVEALYRSQHQYHSYIAPVDPIGSIVVLSMHFSTGKSTIAGGGKALHRNPSCRGTGQPSPSRRNQLRIGVEPAIKSQLANTICLIRACIRMLLGSIPEQRRAPRRVQLLGGTVAALEQQKSELPAF